MALPSDQPPPYEFPRGGTAFNRDEVITIAVLGSTGSGKSTFINLLTGANLAVSAKLQSCTQTVSITETYSLGGNTYRFIDTPGFDDTDRSEVEILKLIAKFLGSHYKQGAKIHGILYLYRISDNRMGATSRRAFRLFRKLCGDPSLGNVAIVTTMWNKVTEADGARRETELREDDRFFKPAIKEGATMTRHDNTHLSALRVVNIISERHHCPIPLTIQTELVKQRKQIVETDAGRELEHDLQELSRKSMQEMQDAMADRRQSIADHDVRAMNEMAEELAKLRMELTHVRNELGNLQVRVDEDFDAEKRWKSMTREARVMTMFMRSQGGGIQQSPENLRFWSALGDTTKAVTKLGSIFDKSPMRTGLQDGLFDFNNNSFDTLRAVAVNRELKQWIRIQIKDVKNMEAIMEKVVWKASKQKKQRKWLIW